MEAVNSYTFGWQNVRGWLSEEEAAELAKLAEGKVVLEVGTFCGRSALAMAATARKVFCVDNFMGYYDRGTGMSDVRDEALGNFDRARTGRKIVVLQGSQEDVLPKMNLADVEMVFYDADHSRDATARGIRLLQAAGLPSIATWVFHDYDRKNLGVMTAVNDFCGPQGMKPRVVGSLAIFDGRETEKEPEAVEQYSVMLGIPTHSRTLNYGAAQGLFRASWSHKVKVDVSESSLLAKAFNTLWCNALNRAEAGDITHLAFLHTDIAPCDGWIDILIEEMEKHGASFCSAISPIKDPRGLTSTGLGEPGLSWSPLRRFSMAEVAEFPTTFDAESIGHPGKVLLLNSGCWVADLRDRQFFARGTDNEARVFFTINDRVVCEDGTWVAQVESEDWFFSRRMHELGIKAVATRAVSLKHMGVAAYPNDVVWGTLEHDEDLRPLWDPEGSLAKKKKGCEA